MKNRFKRSQERKEAREAEKFKVDQEKKNKEKPKHKQKWRRLSDGGVAFGNQYKIGRGGLVAFACIGAIAVFFAVGLTLYPIQDEDMGSMEHCAGPFCEWIDILTGADEYGAKQTPKEQVPLEDRDFLPPPKEVGAGAGFLFPLIPEAEARGDDEPTCYSQACKNRHEEAKEHFATEEAQAKSLNEQIVDTKVKIDKTKDVIDIIEEKIRDYSLTIPQDELDLRLLEQDVEDQQDIVKELRYEWDRMRYNYADKEELDEFEKGYRDEQKKLKDLEFNYDKLENDIVRDKEILEKEEEMLDMAEVDLLMFIDDLNNLKIKLHKIHRAGNLFAIRLSETCNTLIKEGMNERDVIVEMKDNWVSETKTEQICPTYRDLKEMFDNTLEPISGEFIDYGYDIRRSESGYDNYWRYYYNLPNWKVFTVDPDVDMIHRAMIIEVQASEFRYTPETQQELNSMQFMDGGVSERGYVYYENVSIDDECRHANVAPDVELIGKVLKHFMAECEGDLDYVMEHRVIMPYISFDKMEHQWYSYVSWLNNAIKEYGPK